MGPAVVPVVLSALVVAVRGSYVLTFQDKFESLDNWVAVNQPGADTGNNEWELVSSELCSCLVSPGPCTPLAL